MLKKLLFLVWIAIAAELILRLVFTLPVTLRWMDSHSGVWSDSEDLRRIFWVLRGETEYPIDRWDVNRGWALKAGLAAVECCGARISSNSIGIRSIYETDLERQKSRVLVFGDSYTFGEEVQDFEPYPVVMNAWLPGHEILNFGVHGYGFDQMLLYLKESLSKLKPRAVILGYVDDDGHRGMYSFRDFAKPRFDENLNLIGVPVPSPEEVRSAEVWRSKLFSIGRAIFEIRRRSSNGYWQDVNRLNEAILPEFARVAREGGAEVVFVYLPTDAGIREPGGKVALEREKEFFRYCEKAQARCLSLLPRFRNEIAAGAAVSPASRHWSPLEHSLAAEEIARFLKAEKILN